MAIHKKVKTLVYIDPIGNDNLKTLIMEVSAEGEAKLTCITARESEYLAILSWREIIKILYQKDGQIKVSAGSGLVDIGNYSGQVCFIFSNPPGRSGVACYVTLEDFRNAVITLNK
jgi:hypothetical protein